MRRMIALISVAAMMLAMSAMPAMAAPVVTGGLVNVTLVDVVDVNNNVIEVDVPIRVAANLCDISVGVLVQDVRDGATSCTAAA